MWEFASCRVLPAFAVCTSIAVVGTTAVKGCPGGCRAFCAIKLLCSVPR
jgi:hypothetical protein